MLNSPSHEFFVVLSEKAGAKIQKIIDNGQIRNENIRF